MADKDQILTRLGGTQNTPSIASAATVLAANTARAGFQIQNLGTATIFILLGSGASTSVFHMVLKGSTGNDDGTGGSFGMFGPAVYTGIVTVASAGTIRYTVLELT